MGILEPCAFANAEVYSLDFVIGLQGGDLPLSLDARNIGDVMVIRCAGRIVAGSEAESLRERISTAMQDRRYFVLHLGEIAFVDSSGLGMLVRLLTSIRRLGGDLTLCQVPESVLKVLKITGLVRLFDVLESEDSAVSSIYKRSARSEQATSPGPTVLCVDQSNDVLACLRQILGSAGYNVLSNTNLYDSLILMRASRPDLLVLGPSLGGSPGTQQSFRDACASVPVVELGEHFSTDDAGHAATSLLTKINSCRHARASSPAQ